MNASLDLKNVNYVYAHNTATHRHALARINLKIEQGSYLLILGHTGSGKSTLLRIAAGLLEPTDGSVTSYNKKINPGDIGIVFQQPESQLFERTIYDEILFGPRNGGIAATKEQEDQLVRTALAYVGMDFTDFAQRSPFSLSGGEARRVAIASVLASNPSVVLFDEPTAGLDAKGRKFLHALIDQLQGKGVAVVVVSHDLDEFLPRAKSVVLLEAGRKAWQGAAVDLISDPRPLEDSQMKLPALLEFQKQLGREWGTLSYDPQEVAAWALSQSVEDFSIKKGDRQ